MKSNKIEVTQRVKFKCCYIFRRNYEPEFYMNEFIFEATVEAQAQYANSGQVISFEDLRGLCKKVVPETCSFLCYESDPVSCEFGEMFEYYDFNKVNYPFEFSTEQFLDNISLKLMNLLAVRFPEVRLKETRLREDANSFVSWKPRKEK